MAASDRKISQGLEHLRQAEKYMKTSIFKWKPDYDSAVAEYGKAGVAFKNAKAYEQATSSYLKCAEVQKQMGSSFHAAKSMEAASLIYKDMKELEHAADLVEQASLLYLEHGAPDTAAIALERAAKMVETVHPDRAIQLYMRAVDVVEGEDSVRSCAEYMGKAGRLLIRQKRYEDATAALQREMDYYAAVDHGGMLYKLVLAMVLVNLHREDYVAADIAFKKCCQYEGFVESEEAGPIQRLLDAYEQGDQEDVDAVCQSPLFRYMENDFTKLARDLRVPGGRKAPSGGNGPSGEGGADDDENEGLDLK